MFATSQRFRVIGGERGFFTKALEVMKVPGLMLRQGVILNPLSSIMIAVTAGRNPEKLTVQHNVFLKFSSFRFHFLIGILVDEPDRIGKACIPALKKVSN